MAQRVSVQLVDDIDGSDADDTVTFGLDGTTYEIDLSKQHAAELRDALAPFVGAARRAGSGGGRGPGNRRGRSGGSSSRQRSAEIRTWARERGLQVNERGRIPANIVEQFESASS